MNLRNMAFLFSRQFYHIAEGFSIEMTLDEPLAP